MCAWAHKLVGTWRRRCSHSWVTVMAALPAPRAANIRPIATLRRFLAAVSGGPKIWFIEFFHSNSHLGLTLLQMLFVVWWDYTRKQVKQVPPRTYMMPCYKCNSFTTGSWYGSETSYHKDRIRIANLNAVDSAYYLKDCDEYLGRSLLVWLTTIVILMELSLNEIGCDITVSSKNTLAYRLGSSIKISIQK